MVRSCVVVLALVSCVTAVPYGFGTKPGALAKAEASATSGAYAALPAVPLSIPSVGGYSGSFSKSSSSSFASSSASSSSSSFSFSGAGANAIGANSLPNLPNGFSASGATSLASATAGAASQAAAGSSTFTHSVGSLPCTASKCGSTGHQQNVNDNKDCSSGKCPTSTLTPSSISNDANLQAGDSSPVLPYDPDVFEVDVGGKSKSKPNVGGQVSSPGWSPSGSGTPTISHEKPATDLLTPYVGPTCTTHNCKPSVDKNSNGKPSSYNVPIFGTLETSPQYNSNAQNTAPFYNAPSVSSSKPSTTEHKVPDYSGSSYSSKFPSGSTGSPNLNPSPVDFTNSACNTPNCHVPNVNSNAYNTNSQPEHLKPETVSSKQPTSGLPGINFKPDLTRPGYGTYPGHSEGSVKPDYNGPSKTSGVFNAPSHQTDSEKPVTGAITPSQNVPAYTGGFGAPSGSYDTSFGPVKPNYDKSPHSNTKPYNTNYGEKTGVGHDVAKPSSNVSPFSQSTPQPINSFGGTSSHNAPTYTGGFGAPSGHFNNNFGPVKQTNDKTPHSNTKPYNTLEAGYDVPKPSSTVAPFGQSTPQYSSFGGAAASVNYNTGSSTNFQSELNDNKPKSPNTHNTNIAPSTTGQNSHGQQTGVSGAFPASHGTPSHGYGTPTGALNGNSDVNTHYQQPSSNAGATKPNVGTPVVPLLEHGTLDTPKPNPVVDTNNQKTPTYTGGFGGPPGTFHTNGKIGTQFQSKGSTNYDTGSSTNFESELNHNKPTYPNTGAHSINFGASGQNSLGQQIPTSGAIPSPHGIPSHTSGFSTPSSSVNGNSDVNKHFKQPSLNAVPTKPSVGTPFASVPGQETLNTNNQKTPTYTGGFGGPSGTINTNGKIGTFFQSKPTQNQVQSQHTQSTAQHDASFGNTLNSESGYSHDSRTPSDSLSPPVYNKPGNGNYDGGANVFKPGTDTTKPVNDKSKSPVYTGGFGGPAGLLKLNDYSLPAKLPSSSTNNNYPAPCASGGDCGSKTVPNIPDGKLSSSGATAGATASTNAKATAYSGGFGGPPGVLKPYDDSHHSKHGQTQGNDASHGHSHSLSGDRTGFGATSLTNENDDANKLPSGAGQSGSNANAIANAVAFASSNAFSTNQNLPSSGCQSGCSNTVPQTNYASGLSQSKAGGLNDHTGLVGSTAGASASASSVAGAGAGAFGAAGSFASSSAHSSAGAAVKGGYGR